MFGSDIGMFTSSYSGTGGSTFSFFLFKLHLESVTPKRMPDMRMINEETMKHTDRIRMSVFVFDKSSAQI